jgi:hypothetical protein
LLRSARVPDCQRIAWRKLLGVDITAIVGAAHITDHKILVRKEVGGNCFGAFVISSVSWNDCKSHGLKPFKGGAENFVLINLA